MSECIKLSQGFLALAPQGVGLVEDRRDPPLLLDRRQFELETFELAPIQLWDVCPVEYDVAYLRKSLPRMTYPRNAGSICKVSIFSAYISALQIPWKPT